MTITVSLYSPRDVPGVTCDAGSYGGVGSKVQVLRLTLTILSQPSLNSFMTFRIWHCELLASMLSPGTNYVEFSERT